MRVRSSILLACMVIVPAMAMFSHKVPAETRRQLRQALWGQVQHALVPADAAASEPEPTLAIPIPPVAPSAPPDSWGAAIGQERADRDAVRPLFGDASTLVADRGPGGLPEAMPANAIPRDRARLEARLRDLGCAAVEWTPEAGADGSLRCSCRIRAEPTGQLQRVFQASGPDPVAALEALVGEVTAWSARQPTGGPGAPAVQTR